MEMKRSNFKRVDGFDEVIEILKMGNCGGIKCEKCPLSCENSTSDKSCEENKYADSTSGCNDGTFDFKKQQSALEFERLFILKEEDKMKFKKEDLSTRHIIKVRSGRIYALTEWKGQGEELHVVCSNGLNSSTIGSFNLKEIREDLTATFGGTSYDIMAIKEYDNTHTAHRAVRENHYIIQWDWEREEKTPQQIKIEELEKTINEAQRQIQDLKGSE